MVRLLILATIALWSCQQDSNEDTEVQSQCVPDQFSEELIYSDVQSIFSNNCTSCHSGESPTGNLNLESYSGVVSRIVPGSLSSSEIYIRITSNGSTRMPPSGLITTEDQEVIRDWILSCAPEQ